MGKITWADKVTLNPQPTIARENKVIDDDMNEIKNVVNGNDTNVGDLTDLNTTDKSSLVNAINEVNAKVGITTLWSGTQSSGSVSFNESIQNYDFILIGIQASGFSKNSILIPVNDIVIGSGNADAYEIAVFQKNDVYVSMQFKFLSNTILDITSYYMIGWDSVHLKYVIGIKL